MGFRLVSLEGNPITKMKIWTRKCSSCFRFVCVCGLIDSICINEHCSFCPSCGNRSLKRVQAFMTRNGVVGVGDFSSPRAHKAKKRTKPKNQSSGNGSGSSNGSGSGSGSSNNHNKSQTKPKETNESKQYNTTRM